MTLNDAVAVLNDRRHRDHSAWAAEDLGGEPIVCGDDRDEWLTAFEAVAVAEAYLATTPPVSPFRYGGYTLPEAVDALSAYDSGATDAGVRDDGMRAAVRAYLLSLSDEDRRLELARCVRATLSDETVRQGYGCDDALSLIEWFDELLGR